MWVPAKGSDVPGGASALPRLDAEGERSGSSIALRSRMTVGRREGDVRTDSAQVWTIRTGPVELTRVMPQQRPWPARCPPGRRFDLTDRRDLPANFAPWVRVRDRHGAAFAGGQQWCQRIARAGQEAGRGEAGPSRGQGAGGPIHGNPRGSCVSAVCRWDAGRRRFLGERARRHLTSSVVGPAPRPERGSPCRTFVRSGVSEQRQHWAMSLRAATRLSESPCQRRPRVTLRVGEGDVRRDAATSSSRPVKRLRSGECPGLSQITRLHG